MAARNSQTTTVPWSLPLDDGTNDALRELRFALARRQCSREHGASSTRGEATATR